MFMRIRPFLKKKIQYIFLDSLARAPKHDITKGVGADLTKKHDQKDTLRCLKEHFFLWKIASMSLLGIFNVLFPNV